MTEPKFPICIQLNEKDYADLRLLMEKEITQITIFRKGLEVLLAEIDKEKI